MSVALIMFLIDRCGLSAFPLIMDAYPPVVCMAMPVSLYDSLPNSSQQANAQSSSQRMRVTFRPPSLTS